MNQRTSGILLHITSLPNRFPIGDLGPSAYEFVDFLSDSGQKWWQVLPIGPTQKDNSPYQPASAFAGNPLLISPELLLKQGLLNAQHIACAKAHANDKVDFQKAKKFKSILLKKAFTNFEKRKNSSLQSEFDIFVHAQSYWLDDFALFQTICKKERTSDWTKWDHTLKSRNPQALSKAKKSFGYEFYYYQFVQWQFSIQWQALQAYCQNKGVGLIGDIPLFVAHHSVDVWAHPEIFKLNSIGNPTVEAGVPPDYFSQTGQLWNVPVYSWEALQKQKYTWWIERLKNASKQFDILRLDHFIGFIHTYEVAINAKTAQHGQYQAGGGLPFFTSLQKALGRLPFIADDLGAITDEVKTLRNTLKIPGTKVLQFELNSILSSRGLPAGSKDGRLDPAVKPRDDSAKQFNDNAHCILYTGTHDNNTSKEWYKALSMKQRRILRQNLHTSSYDFHWAMIRTALASEANIVIIPMQDVLGLGAQARMNFPGKAKGNWKWRLKKRALKIPLAKKMFKLIQIFKRGEE